MSATSCALWRGVRMARARAIVHLYPFAVPIRLLVLCYARTRYAGRPCSDERASGSSVVGASARDSANADAAAAAA